MQTESCDRVSSLPRVRPTASALAVQIKRPTLFFHNMPTFFICIHSSPSRSTIPQAYLSQYDYTVFVYIYSHRNFLESPTQRTIFSLEVLNVQHVFFAGRKGDTGADLDHFEVIVEIQRDG
jgi:hypothetical protein